MRFPWSEEIAIDLGSANTLVSVKGAGVVVREPTVIAFDASGRRPVAIGLEAKRMLERDVSGVRVCRPVRGGVVADFDAAVTLLRALVSQALGKRPLISPMVTTSHPNSSTTVEQRALVQVVRAAGGGEVLTVQRALATALGAGMPVDGDVSRMVIDMGAGVTNVGVIAMGMTTAGVSVRHGGDDLDEMIRRAVRRAQGIRISPASAEQVKLRVGTLLEHEEHESMRVDGVAADGEKDMSLDIPLTGVPELLMRGLARAMSEIMWLLEDLPPQAQTEIAANGAILTGGGALLGGVDAYLAERLGIPVAVATDPMSCTILGLESILNAPQAVSLDGRRFRA